MNKIGVFASSLLVTAMAVYIWSPVIGSNATDGQTTKLSAQINPVASITLDTNNLVFNVTPTDAGVFQSSPITATVQTNSTGGYELYFSAEDNNTDMIHSDSTITNVIASDFEGTVTSSAMAKEKWGYSLDDTDFSKIPTASSQVQLRNLDHYPSASEQETAVYIGTKISSNLPSGTYSKNVKFSVLAHETPLPPFGGIFSMQEMTGEICSAAAVGESTTLTDTRDSNTYTVKKLADGKCWMAENLRLINKTISSTDSNLPSGETYTVPASNVSSFTTSYNTNSAYLDSIYGGYYNFYTATAGWGTYSVTSGNSPKDICPKGWRLPTGGSSGEFQTLYNNYSSSTFMQGVPNFTFSGHIYDGSVNLQGSSGGFWSSTVNNSENAYRLYLNSSNVYPANRTNKGYGFSVRCVAKEPTMQTFESSMLQNVGDSMQLEDERDGNKYTVKKLADGNVWMTENLRLINKTISSTDSNLPSGETYTVPASNHSSFTTDDYNINAAYLDSTYGGYYSFDTATAGWGTNSVISGNSPKDICPKGWRLPTGGDSGEFQTLYNNYNSAALMRDEPNFTFSGDVYNGSVGYQGGSGYFWSSTVYNAYNAYDLYLNSSDVEPVLISNKRDGFSVRCVAK